MSDLDPDPPQWTTYVVENPDPRPATVRPGPTTPQNDWIDRRELEEMMPSPGELIVAGNRIRACAKHYISDPAWRNLKNQAEVQYAKMLDETRPSMVYLRNRLVEVFGLKAGRTDADRLEWMIAHGWVPDRQGIDRAIEDEARR